jgi:hypothetical protein
VASRVVLCSTELVSQARIYSCTVGEFNFSLHQEITSSTDSFLGLCNDIFVVLSYIFTVKLQFFWTNSENITCSKSNNLNSINYSLLRMSQRNVVS